MRRALLPLSITACLALGGLRCAKGSDEAPLSRAASPLKLKPSTPPAETAAEADKDDRAAGVGGGEGKAANQVAAMPRKIIRNGEVRLVVKAYAPARKKIEALVRRSGGYISKSEVHHSLGHVSSATIVLRVPSGRFDGLVASILRLGVVEHESIGSRDVSEQYYDLKARLSNARKLEARYLELLEKQAGKVTELLQVEKELARVREKIERFEGKLRLLDNLVDLSTLTITLSIRQKYTPPTPPDLGDDASDTLSGSWDALKSLGRGLVLMLVALLPWLVPIGVITYVTWWLIRRSIRRRRERRAAALAAQGQPPTPGAGPGPGPV